MENAERRLELIRMMRNEHKENIVRIQKREHILYPEKKISYPDHLSYNNRTIKPYAFEENLSSENDIDLVGRRSNIGFYIRFGISVSLFLVFFYMDMNDTDYFGLTCDMVQDLISETFDLKSFAFIK